MRRVLLIVALVFLALAIFLFVTALDLPYYTPIGPGPGFFPLWLSGCLALLSLIWAGQLYLARIPGAATDLLPDRSGAIRLTVIAGMLILYVVLIRPFGFRLTTLVFLAILLQALGRHNVLLTTAIAVAGSFGLYELFQRLDVNLPVASLDVLQLLSP